MGNTALRAALAAIAFTASAGAASAAETVTVTGHPPSPDICLKIAAAKFQQWHQARVAIQQTKEFPNGTEAITKIIVTPNTMFIGHGALWKSGNITIKDRKARSPEMVQQAMGLADCAPGEHVTEAGHPATTYTYSQLSDTETAQGVIWVADNTGLPLRQEMTEGTPSTHHGVADKMLAVYAYNDDVQVPLAASAAESNRLFSVFSGMSGFHN